MSALTGATVIAFGAAVAGSDFLSPKISKKESGKLSEVEDEYGTETMRETSLEKREGKAGETTDFIKKDGDRIRFRSKQILLTMVPFAVLGAAFKVMVLIEGVAEVRPANAILMVSGYLFGPFGALGCVAGNLLADCFGITWKNILIYIWSVYVGALACAWILGFGLEIFSSLWIDTVYKYVFLTNFGFSIALGMDISVSCCLDGSPDRNFGWCLYGISFINKANHGCIVDSYRVMYDYDVFITYTERKPY